MIDKYDLFKITQLTNYNLGQAEISFYQDLILFMIYKKYSRQIIFKGGTALTKCYGFDRFSEDLDFTITKDIKNIQEYIKIGLLNFNIDFDIKFTKQTKSKKIKLLIRGPLYKTGDKRTLCSLSIDMSTREEIILEPNIIKIRPAINLVPMFDIVVMNKTEIFAEKVRTVFTRNQARDLYDLYYLDDSIADLKLINKKLKFYGEISFTKNKYKNEIQKIKSIWDAEMKHLLVNYPEFEDVKKKLASYFKK